MKMGNDQARRHVSRGCQCGRRGPVLLGGLGDPSTPTKSGAASSGTGSQMCIGDNAFSCQTFAQLLPSPFPSACKVHPGDYRRMNRARALSALVRRDTSQNYERIALWQVRIV